MASLGAIFTWELLGTAMLTLLGCGVVANVTLRNALGHNGGWLLINFGWGFAVFAGASVAWESGAHINPAVTFGLAATGKFSWADVPSYVAAQVLGATVGAFAIVGVLGTKASDIGLGVAAYADSVPWYQAACAEFIGTVLLVFAVFGVIYRKAAPGWAGLAIGMVVFAAIIPVAPTTGASINPARTIGPMFVQQLAGGAVAWEQLPVYLVAELLGGIVGGVLFGFIAHTAADRKRAAEAAPELAEIPAS